MSRLDRTIRYGGAGVILLVAGTNILAGLTIAPLGINLLHIIGGACLGALALRTRSTKGRPA